MEGCGGFVWRKGINTLSHQVALRPDKYIPRNYFLKGSDLKADIT